MIDRNILLAKADKVDRHLRRIREKRIVSLDQFLEDLDRQESVLFNVQMAIQNCIDMAAHIISDEDLGVAGSTNEMFYLLQENGYLDPGLTEKMFASVGFRRKISIVVSSFWKKGKPSTMPFSIDPLRRKSNEGQVFFRYGYCTRRICR